MLQIKKKTHKAYLKFQYLTWLAMSREFPAESGSVTYPPIFKANMLNSELSCWTLVFCQVVCIKYICDLQ